MWGVVSCREEREGRGVADCEVWSAAERRGGGGGEGLTVRLVMIATPPPSGAEPAPDPAGGNRGCEWGQRRV